MSENNLKRPRDSDDGRLSFPRARICLEDLSTDIPSDGRNVHISQNLRKLAKDNPPPLYLTDDEIAAIQPYVMDDFMNRYQGAKFESKDLHFLIKKAPDCIGLLLITGDTLIKNGMEKDDERMAADGIAILKCAANELKDPMAHYLLGLRLIDAPEVAENHLRKAAYGGVIKAFAPAGNLIKKRDGSDASLKEALTFYKKGALMNDADSHYSLFIMSLLGIGCVKDTELAFKYLREAADLGHSLACYRYGNALRLGTGVQKDERKAFMYFSTAANKGHVRSLLFLGWSHRKGCFLKRDYLSAYDFYKRAIETNEAKYAIARMLLKKRIPRKENWEAEVLSLLQSASMDGHYRATYRLAILESKKNPENAFQLFKEAAQSGYGGAYKRLGKIMHEKGNDIEAIYYFGIGVTKGDPGCMYQLAKMYLTPNKSWTNIAAGEKFLNDAIVRRYDKALLTAMIRGQVKAINIVSGVRIVETIKR